MDKFNIRSLITRGAAHPLRCEDDLFVKETDELIIAAVFDGCSSGIDSHVASSLHKKLLSSLEFDLIDDIGDVKALGHDLLEYLYTKLFYYYKAYGFRINEEMLSTVIILVVNKYTSDYNIVVAGDGLVNVNAHYLNIHDSTGESVFYLSSIIDDKTTELNFFEPFEKYYNNECTVFTGTNFDNVAISTDGIDTFKTKFGRMLGEAPRDFFMKNRTFEKAPNQLKRLYNIYTQGLHLEDRTPSLNMDDFTMIKITHGTT